MTILLSDCSASARPNCGDETPKVGVTQPKAPPNVVSSVPSALKRVASRVAGPPPVGVLSPATTILPSGCSATALAVSFAPKSGWFTPLPLSYEVSSAPWAVKRAVTTSDVVPPGEIAVPATTTRPSGCTASPATLAL